MNRDIKKWVYLFVLSIIWGSSYILIKKGLVGLSPLQLGSIRILFTFVLLLLMGARSLSKIPKDRWGWLALSGFLGTFFPNYLFAFAETAIDSSIAAVLNGLTPLFTLLLGLLFFKSRLLKKQLVGVLVGFVGTLILVSEGASVATTGKSLYAFLVVIAAFCYALNVNIIKYRLQNVSAMGIALGNFIAIVVPAILVLSTTSFSVNEAMQNPEIQTALGYIFILALFGTALAKVMFNELVAISSPVFSISITYLLPIVAIGWGILDGETFGLLQWAACGLILLGVFLAAERKKGQTRKN
ncbi:MAG: EamA family transporter [Flavobacteriaceae bacterium]